MTDAARLLRAGAEQVEAAKAYLDNAEAMLDRAQRDSVASDEMSATVNALLGIGELLLAIHGRLKAAGIGER